MEALSEAVRQPYAVTLLGGPAHGRRVVPPPSCGGILRWLAAPQVSTLAPGRWDEPLRTEEVIYRRERYAFPFKPPRDFVVDQTHTDWRNVEYGPIYKASMHYISLWATETGHLAIRDELGRFNAAIEK